MDIKAKAEEIIKKVTTDKSFAAKFKKDPAKAIEGVVGVDLPEDQINSILKTVTAKVSLDSLGGLLDTDGDGKPDLGAVSKLTGFLKK